MLGRGDAGRGPNPFRAEVLFALLFEPHNADKARLDVIDRLARQTAF